MTDESAAEIALRNAGMTWNGTEPTEADEARYAEADMLVSGRPPAVKFTGIGDTVTGRVVDVFTQQERIFGTQDLKFWDDGRPVMSIAAVLETAEGPQTLYVGSQKMRMAIGAACQAAKVRGLRPGGMLVVKYTGDDEPKTKGAKGAKLYDAAYDPPGRKPLDPAPDLQAQLAASEEPPF